MRNLVSQITTKGAKLYDLLGKEVELGVCLTEYSNLFSFQISNVKISKMFCCFSRK